MIRYAIPLLLFPALLAAPRVLPSPSDAPITWWPVQAIDTMKYSRDASRTWIADRKYDRDIVRQTEQIAGTGATHISIGTPYDDEFIPMLERWVAAARENGLRVWFRGNFSGWEEWFGYKRIDRAAHLEMMSRFIENNPGLFRNGDIFSSCPECENGGPGDPRATGDTNGHRKFLIDQYRTCLSAFGNIGLNVRCNYFSMNGDVAKVIMDKDTTAALGGIVVIDHYVKDPETLERDIRDIAARSGGNIVLGEMGAPIPDIHGQMAEGDQAEWLQQAFDRLTGIPQLIGINYWTNQGSSTALWTEEGIRRPAADAVKRAYHVYRFESVATDIFGRPLGDVEISSGKKTVISGGSGSFSIPYTLTDKQITLDKSGYTPRVLKIPVAGSPKTVVLEYSDTSPGSTVAKYAQYYWERIVYWFGYK